MEFLNRAELLNIGADYVAQNSKKIDPFQVFVEGSDINLFVGVGSVMCHAIMLQLAFSMHRLILDDAEDEDLDRYAFDRYNERRKGASAAVGTIRFFRSVSGVAGTISAGTKLSTNTGIEYITTTDASFGLTDLVAFANIRAVQAGKAFQVGANTIRLFSDPALIFDKTIRCINDIGKPTINTVTSINNAINGNFTTLPAILSDLSTEGRTAGGEDREEDNDFRERIRSFWRTARKGTLEAIEQGALSVDGVVSAQAIEALTQDNRPARIVLLYIADSSGVANQVLAAAVSKSLNEYRAGGITVIVYAGSPEMLNVTLSLSFISNSDTDTLVGQIIAAVVEFVNSLKVNQAFLRSELKGVLTRFSQSGLVVTDNTIVSPAGDLIPAAGHTLRITTDRVKVL